MNQIQEIGMNAIAFNALGQLISGQQRQDEYINPIAYYNPVINLLTNE